MAYDSLLVQAGREPKFLPFMGTAYTKVFGEVPEKLAGNRPLVKGQTPTPTKKEVESVTDLVTSYHKLSPSYRLDFLT